MKVIIFPTDFLVFLMATILGAYISFFRKTKEYDLIFNQLNEKPRYLVALMVLLTYGCIGLIDCLHFQFDDSSIKSLLDVIVSPRDSQSETTYSAPFSFYAHAPSLIHDSSGKLTEIYPKLSFSGQHLTNTSFAKIWDILQRISLAFSLGLLAFVGTLLLVRKFSKNTRFDNIKTFSCATLGIIMSIGFSAYFLLQEYHIFGTDKIGRDIFYITIKSIRTGLIIGSISTFIMLPFALAFGMCAGYFRGWVDDVIQYVYITLSSIPSILLITAAMLSFQARVEISPDLRLLILCIILGVTNWTSLCRLLRGETLKLREVEFVQCAITLGVRPFTIIKTHVLPNLMHVVIISVILDFSNLVLAEAILSYIGVGVDPASFSWGNLINASRLDMARDPMVWWPLCGSLLMMFVLVFSANIFSEALQDALNSRDK